MSLEAPSSPEDSEAGLQAARAEVKALARPESCTLLRCPTEGSLEARAASLEAPSNLEGLHAPREALAGQVAFLEEGLDCSSQAEGVEESEESRRREEAQALAVCLPCRNRLLQLAE